MKKEMRDSTGRSNRFDGMRVQGITPRENVFGTEFAYDSATGEISNILRVSGGYGKVAVLEELELRLQISRDRTIYVGDGSSDLYVMHHVNSRDGHTIAVSETKSIGRIAKRTVLSASHLVFWSRFSKTSSNGTRIRFASCSLRTVSACRIGTRFGRTGSRFTQHLSESVIRPRRSLGFWMTMADDQPLPARDGRRVGFCLHRGFPQGRCQRIMSCG